MSISYDYFGNTTLRVKNILLNIEEQLILLNRLFVENPKLKWVAGGNLQNMYADMLIEAGLLETTDFIKKAKTARQKTSPLEDFGFINRKSGQITAKGQTLLQLQKTRDIKKKNNFLQIELASMLFLSNFFSYKKQDQRTDIFWLYLKVFKSLNYELSAESFLLLPLLNNFATQNEFIHALKSLQDGTVGVDFIIKNVLRKDITLIQKKDDFVNDYNMNNDITGDYFNTAKGRGMVYKIKNLFYLFIAIMNKEQDVFILFQTLTDDEYIRKNYLNNIYGKISNNKTNHKKMFTIVKSFVDSMAINFLEEFFYFIYTCRIKNNLNDYYDLNRRYLKLTDCFEFRSDKITMTDNFKVFLSHPDEGFVKSSLTTALSTENSLDFLFKDEYILNKLKLYGVDSPEDLRQYKYNADKAKLQELINTKFSQKLLTEKIIPLFKNRTKQSDNKLFELVTTEATIPTIFEYIVAIAWSHIDDKNLDIILDAGMSLDSDLLPKSHAVGGEADILINYSDHFLMLEVTLTEQSNQRRAEMEPVSRHLGNLLIKTEDRLKKDNSYAIFIAPYLDSNVLNDFRARQNMIYENYGKHVEGMDILPMDTDDLIAILKNGSSYSLVRNKFYNVLASPTKHGSIWYNNEVKPIYQSRA